MTTEFRFLSPTLFEPTATPDAELLGILHDAPGLAPAMAKSKKLADWLKAQVTSNGISAAGPFVDEGSWIVELQSLDGPVVCLLSGGENDEPRFHLLVMELDPGQAAEKLVADLTNILHNSREIIDMNSKFVA